MNCRASPLRALPERDGRDVALVYEIDRWDGPITGLVRVGGELFWFEWEEERRGDEAVEGPRVYALHAIGDVEGAEIWAARHQQLRDEYLLAANSETWPMPARQRSSLRPCDTIEAELREHHHRRPPWEERIPVAWFRGATGEFAAIQVVKADGVTSERLKAWQREVAVALVGEDQPALDRLFVTPPIPCDPREIYFVQRPGTQEWVIRDHRGQPLPEDFVITARHRPECLDSCLSPNP